MHLRTEKPPQTTKHEKNKENDNPNEVATANTQDKQTKKPTYSPPAWIDIITDENLESFRTEKQPFDWTKVKMPRRRWETRPTLSESVNEKANEDLEKHFQEKYQIENPPKTRPQKNITPDMRQKIITDMLTKGALNVGVAPITADRIQRLEKILLQRGILNKNESPTLRKERTIKSLVKSWVAKYLKMSDRDWDTIQIKSITLTENSDIAFINCLTHDDAKEFTSRAANIPHDNNENAPRMVMYIDRRAAKRHKAIATIAKTIRNQSNNTVQTSIRVGKKDFLFRQRPKGSSIQWADIAPITIHQQLPDFEVGIYDDIVNPSNNLDDNVDPLSDDMLEAVAQDISKQKSQSQN